MGPAARKKYKCDSKTCGGSNCIPNSDCADMNPLTQPPTPSPSPSPSLSPTPSVSPSPTPTPSYSCPSCQSKQLTCDDNACANSVSGENACARCITIDDINTTCSDGRRVTLTGCKTCKQISSVCGNSGCYIDQKSCPGNCTETAKFNQTCNFFESCYCPSTPSSTPSSSPSPSGTPSPSPSCDCRNQPNADCYSNCTDCETFCQKYPSGTCSCTGGKPLGICPGSGITCCCAGFSTPSPSASPSGSPSPTPSCCGVKNCCEDYNLLNTLVNNVVTGSGGCANCNISAQDISDECDPKKCAKKRCYTANCTNLGQRRANVGVIVAGACRVQYNACTAAQSPIQTGPCQGFYPSAGGFSGPVSC